MIDARLRSTVALIALAVCYAPASAGAQAAPSFPEDLGAVTAEDAYGVGLQELWVQGIEFTKTSGNPDLAIGSDHFVHAAGAPSAHYYAPLRLPVGGVITGLVCIVDDTDGSRTTDVILYRDVLSFSDLQIQQYLLGEVFAPGSSGHYVTNTAALNHSFQGFFSDVSGDHRASYYLDAYLGDNMGLFGCVVYWHRSIAPAPAVATFSDVPVGNTQRQYIEAMAAAGISTGCGGTKYCPDDPVTRGQLAVLLARALGLHWPN